MLAIDVGNTHITGAFVEGAEVRLVRRIPTETYLKNGRLLDHLLNDGFAVPREIVISSVRRPVTEMIGKECMASFGVTPLVVTSQTPMGIVNRYMTNDTLGVDRLVDAAACHHLYTRGKGPGIVVDMGTATTVDYITGQGEFLGGAIVPGLVSAYRGLLMNAPELPEIEISPVDSVIGATTKDCMRAGVMAGHAALVQALASLMAKERGEKPLVVVTGGLAAVVDALLPEEYVRDEHLMLKGLAVIHHINGNGRQC